MIPVKRLIVPALLFFALASCEAPTETPNADSAEDARKVTTSGSSQWSAEAIVKRSEASGYHYFFTGPEAVNKYYTRRRGYFTKADAETGADRPVIEIQTRPHSDEVTQVFYNMKGLPSMKVSVKDMTPMLDFIAMFDSSAHGLFLRNFNTVFHETPGGSDSGRYYNQTGNITIGIDHDLDIVRKDKLTTKDAYIQASIAPY